MYDPTTIARLQADLAASLGAWDLPAESQVSLLNASENATFLVRSGGCATIVRVHRADYHREAEIGSELAWIEALRDQRAVATPAPLPCRDGARIVRIGGADHPRFAVAFEFVPGREPSPVEDLVGWFGTLGAVTARLHRHARDWARPAGFDRKRWDMDGMIGAGAHWGDWRSAPGIAADDRVVLEDAERQVRAMGADYGTASDRFGLIHADLRLANLLIDGDRLSVIDFDDCGFGWFVYDFAAAVSFHEEDAALERWTDAWVAGYRSVAPLADEHVAMIPAFVMLRRLMLTAWIASHAETGTAAAAGADFPAGSARVARRFLARVG